MVIPDTPASHQDDHVYKKMPSWRRVVLGSNPSILRHNGLWGAADIAVLNKVLPDNDDLFHTLLWSSVAWVSYCIAQDQGAYPSTTWHAVVYCMYYSSMDACVWYSMQSFIHEIDIPWREQPRRKINWYVVFKCVQTMCWEIKRKVWGVWGVCYFSYPSMYRYIPQWLSYRPNWDPITFPPSECVPLQEPKREGKHSPGGEGLRRSQFGRLVPSALSTLCPNPTTFSLILWADI